MAAMKNSGLTAEKGKARGSLCVKEKERESLAMGVLSSWLHTSHTWSAERARVYSPWAYRLTLGTHHSRSRPFNSLLQALGGKIPFCTQSLTFSQWVSKSQTSLASKIIFINTFILL